MPTPDDLRFARLAALADGDSAAELDAAGLNAARTDAGGDDALAARIAEQQQLRAACRRIMGEAEVRCPDELRSRLIATLPGPDQGLSEQSGPSAGDPSGGEPTESTPAVAGRIGPGRWVGVFAAAALIAISTVAVVGTLYTLRPGPLPAGAASIVQVIDDGQARLFEFEHQRCGTDPTQLDNFERFPKKLGELDEQLAEIIDANLGSARLDLSGLGYHYAGAGDCVVPGSGAVHIVYRNDAGDALSLWLRADDGRLQLEPGRLYGPPKDSLQDGRILIWKDGNVVFYLVGDLHDAVERAQSELALYPV